MISNRRITRPPGGESSDIFGASSPATTPPSTPRKVKNHMASSIFGSVTGGGGGDHMIYKANRANKDGDSFNRLFGGDVTDTVKKDHMKSSITFQEGGKVNGGAATTEGVVVAVVDGAVNNGHTSPAPPNPPPASNGHFHGGSGSTGSLSGPSSGSSTPNGSINGDYKSSNGNLNVGATTVIPSRRIPPGGYSTKLW